MWYIMSYNSIRGHQSGSFDQLDTLWFGPDIGGNQINWVDMLSMAQAFPTEEAAELQVKSLWGRPGTSFGIVRMDDIDMQMDRWAHERCKTFKAMSKRLAGRQINREELIEMLSNYENVMDNHFTTRESWILEILGLRPDA